MKKILLTVLSVMLLCGCSHENSADNMQMGCEWGSSGCASSSQESENVVIGSPADMSGYESYDPDTQYVFLVSNVNRMIERMNSGDTFVTYFGFSSCPWCRDAMPILNAVALQYDYKVDYIDTRSDSSWSSNLDLTDYDKLVDAIGDLFPTDEDGKQHLDVPFVVFFKDGKVTASAGYPQYDAHERKINETEAEEEKAGYTSGFESLQ